jgi:hypothetical protein
MELVNLINKFCNENDEKYSAYENYSGRGMFGKKCMGIVVKQDYSYLEMLVELTRFLDAHLYDDVECKLEGVSCDSLGLDTIVYFPNIGC